MYFIFFKTNSHINLINAHYNCLTGKYKKNNIKNGCVPNNFYYIAYEFPAVEKADR